VANVFFNRAKKEILDGTIDLVANTLKLLLVNSGYTPNADDDFVSTASGSELSGTGYASGFGGAGRKTLASIAITEDDTNDRGKFTAANVTWTAIDAGTAARAILYKHLTSDAASVMIAAYDGGFPKTTNGGDLTVSWHADGIFYLT
jgi:hypothetical protein